MAQFKGADDFLFAIRTNTPIDLHNAVARHSKPMCRKMGIPEVSWHDLRHTYTTWGRRAGVKAEAMRDQLGHSSVLMTLDVYSHAEDRESEAALIERYAWPEDDRKVAQVEPLMEPEQPGTCCKSLKTLVGAPRLERGTSCV